MLRSILGTSFLAVSMALAAFGGSGPGTSAASLSRLSMALTQTQHADAAISIQELAADSVVPKRARQFYEKALESDRRGRTNLAIEQARAALNAFPRYFHAETAVAIAYLKLANTNEAERHVLAAAALNPHYLPARETQGLIFYFQDRIRDAADALGEVVRKAPCRMTAHYYLSLALRRLGADQEADYHLQTARELEQNPMLPGPALPDPKNPAEWDETERFGRFRRH